MPMITPYFLTFPGGLRVGTRGVKLEEAGLPVPADTLFGALVDAARRAGYDPQTLLEPFLQTPPSPPFRLTSAFPFAGLVRFFPMPPDLSRLFNPACLAARGKQIKQIRYLSQGLLEKALSGQRLEDWLFPEQDAEEPKRGAALQGGSLWLSVSEIGLLPADYPRAEGRRHALRARKVWAESTTPRVTVDRVTSGSTIYHSGRIAFAPGCGLWFGVQWAGQPVDWFSQALSLLESDGLGGERSAGYGAFTATARDAFGLPDPAAGKLAYLLSRYHPRAEELPDALAAPGAAYHLTAVGGWLRSPDGPAQRRKRVQLVAEGSLLALRAGAGDLATVTPTYANPAGDLPHPVYRYGLALAAGWEEPHA